MGGGRVDKLHSGMDSEPRDSWWDGVCSSVFCEFALSLSFLCSALRGQIEPSLIFPFLLSIPTLPELLVAVCIATLCFAGHAHSS